MKDRETIRRIAAIALSLVIVGCTGASASLGDVEPGNDSFPDGREDLWSAEDATPESDGDLSTTGDQAVGADIDPVDPVAFPVIETGQDRCFSATQEIPCPNPGGGFFGQDAQYHGTAADYVDNGDGTVTDLATGLMWQQDPGEKMTFEEALAGADSFSLAGYDDWRLPTIKELYSLMDFRGVTGMSAADSIPYLDTDVFLFEYGDTSIGERFIDAQFASSTQYVSTTMNGDATLFGVNFADGRIKGYGMQMPDGSVKTFFVRYVRGAAYGENDFRDNGDGTVTDLATGLTWQQGDDGVGRNWEEALEYCEDLGLAGSDDWRLPNAKELQGIVDYTRSPDTTGSAALDPIFEAAPIADPNGETNYACYWTSTTHLDGVDLGTYAAYIAFGRAQGFMEMPPDSGNYTLMDVHGAGAQRSDPKAGDPADFPHGHGPQGDVIGIYNHVRCVRGGAAFENREPTSQLPGRATGSCGDGECQEGEAESCPQDCGGRPDGPVACQTQADCDAPGACPPEFSLGCICAPDPQGAKACVPACDSDDDCPQPPGMSLVCSPEGICVPDGGPPF